VSDTVIVLLICMLFEYTLPTTALSTLY